MIQTYKATHEITDNVFLNVEDMLRELGMFNSFDELSDEEFVLYIQIRLENIDKSAMDLSKRLRNSFDALTKTIK